MMTLFHRTSLASATVAALASASARGLRRMVLLCALLAIAAAGTLAAPPAVARQPRSAPAAAPAPAAAQPAVENQNYHPETTIGPYNSAQCPNGYAQFTRQCWERWSVNAATGQSTQVGAQCGAAVFDGCIQP
jgi:hypothetical protein